MIFALGRTAYQVLVHGYLDLQMINSIFFCLAPEVERTLLYTFIFTAAVSGWIGFIYLISVLYEKRRRMERKSEGELDSRGVFTYLLSASVSAAALLYAAYYTRVYKFTFISLALLPVFILGAGLFNLLLVRVMSLSFWNVVRSRLERILSSTAILVVSTFITLSALSITYIITPTLRDTLAEDRPNVILLVVDALRSDRLGAYNRESELTPFIDEFSGQAVVFLNTIAQGSNTINSSPSIFASVYPSEHGYFDFETRVSNRLTMLAEILREDGYHTFGVSSNPNVSSRTGLDQGFDLYIEDGSWRDTDATQVNDTFLRWAQKHGSEPFFAMLWYIDPHSVYDPPDAFAEKLINEELRPLITENTGGPLHKNLTDSEREVSKLLYDGEVNYFDAEFGRLLNKLGELGLFEESIIILTADHGEGFWECDDVNGMPINGHGFSLNRPEIEIPLIIKFPGSAPSRRIVSMVNSIDIVPTILDAVQILEPERYADQLKGESLLPFTNDGSVVEQPRYSFSELITQEDGPFMMRCVQDEEVKLVLTYRYGDNIFDPPREELVIKHGVRLEMTAEERAARTDVLHDQLNRWKQNFHIYSSGITSLNLDEEAMLRERLKALGYIQ